VVQYSITDESSNNQDTWFTSTCMSIHCHRNVVTRTHSHAYTANYVHVDTCSLCLICFQYDSNLWPVMGKSEGRQGRSVGGGDG
jgi:hypothetical protein